MNNRAKIYMVSLGVLFVALVVALSFSWSVSKMGSQYAGVVSTVEDDSFTIVNRHGWVKEIEMGDALIFEGRNQAELRRGDFVIVVGEDNDDVVFEASIIRVVRDGPSQP
jgi:hypothetical protein